MAYKNQKKQPDPPIYNSDPPGTADFEIGDVENYRGDKLQVFNHQTLVMTALSRCSETGSHELRAGWFNEKLDDKGNVSRVYIEDTREKFIASVKNAINVLHCDFDDEAETKIKKLLEELERIKEELKKEQWDWYNNLPPKSKVFFSGEVQKDYLNIGMVWFMKFKEKEVELHRQIFQELNDLTKRLDFYESQDFEV